MGQQISSTASTLKQCGTVARWHRQQSIARARDDTGAADGIRPPADVEVRVPDFSRRDSDTVAYLARAPSCIHPWRVAVFVAQHHHPATVPVPGRRRGSHLLRLDRFHRQQLRRRAQPADVHTTQAQESVDPAQPTTRSRYGRQRPHDRSRPTCHRCREGQRLVDDCRSGRRPRGTTRTRNCPEPRPERPEHLGRFSAQCPQTDAVVGRQRCARRHSLSSNRAHRRRGRGRSASPRLSAVEASPPFDTAATKGPATQRYLPRTTATSRTRPRHR